MELNIINGSSSFRHSEEFKTFARRFSRLSYLKSVCDENHPVLLIEGELIEMAKSKLQEFIFSTFRGKKQLQIRPVMEFCIKTNALENLRKYDVTDEIRDKASEFIRSADLSDLFPRAN